MRDVLNAEIRRVKHKATACFHWAAPENLGVGNPARQSNGLVRLNQIKLHDQVAEGHAWLAVVDDNAHRAICRVTTHVDDAAVETLVVHARHGDQHLAAKQALLPIVAPELLQVHGFNIVLKFDSVKFEH